MSAAESALMQPSGKGEGEIMVDRFSGVKKAHYL
jgi:hypothetical protein